MTTRETRKSVEANRNARLLAASDYAVETLEKRIFLSAAGDGWTAGFYGAEYTTLSQFPTLGNTTVNSGDYVTHVDTLSSVDQYEALPPVDASSNFNNSEGSSPGARFSGHFQTNISVTSGGYYTFYPNTDDGNQIIITGGDSHISLTGTSYLSTGQGPSGPPYYNSGETVVAELPASAMPYTFDMYYNNAGGGWGYQLRWSASSQANGGGTSLISYSAPSETTGSLMSGAGVAGVATLEAPIPTLATTAPIFTSQTNTSIALNWPTHDIDAASFIVERSTSPTGGFAAVNQSSPVPSADGATDSYVDTGLTASTTYYYKIVSNSILGLATDGVNGEPTSPASAAITTLASPPQIAIPVVTLAPSSSGNVLTINQVNNAAAYNISVSNTFNGTYTQIASLPYSSNSTTLTYTDMGNAVANDPVNGNSFYKIQAIDSNNDQATSGIAGPITLYNADSWINPAGGYWDVASNWSTGVVPGPSDNAIIDVAAGATITVRSGTATAGNVISDNPLTVSGGTLAVTGDIQVDSTFTLAGGTLQGGTVLPGTAGQGLTGMSGTLDGATVNANLAITENDNLTVSNGLTLNGTATLGDASGNGGWISFTGTSTLAGTGTVVFGGANPRNGVVASGTDSVLTIGTDITIEGQTGFLGYNTYYGYGSSSATVINHGMIQWTSGTSIMVPTTLTDDGTLALDSNCVFNIGGTLVGGTITTQAGAQIYGTLNGVTVNGNFTITNNNSLTALNGLTLNGIVTLGDASGNGGWITFTGTSTLAGTGTVIFGDASYRNGVVASGTNSVLTIGPDITIEGQTGFLGYNAYYGYGSSSATVINQGAIQWTSGTNIMVPTTLTNDGTITLDSQSVFDIGGTLLGGAIATQTGAQIFGCTLNGVIVNGNFTITNNDSLTILNGLTLNGTATLGDASGNGGFIGFMGTSTLAGAGTVVFGGGSFHSGLVAFGTDSVLTIGPDITIEGQTGFLGYNSYYGYGTSSATVINQGTIQWTSGTNIMAPTTLTDDGTITVDASGVFDIGGTILGGAITAQTGAQIFGCTLNGVTVNGNFTITNHDTLTILNGLTLNGTATLGDASGNGGLISFTGTSTLAGTGTVVFGSASSSNGLLASGANPVLTIGANITIEGQTGYVGYDSYYGYGSASTTVINRGTINSEGGGTIYLPGAGSTNDGIIAAGPSGALDIGGPFTEVAGASLDVVLGGSNAGLYGQVVISGTASLDGSLNVSEANGFLPGTASSFTILTYSSHTGQFANYTGLNISASLALQPTYNATQFSLGTIIVSPDLSVQSVTGPRFEFAGQQAQVSWTVVNSGAGEADGSWTDELQIVSVSTDATTTLGTATGSGPLDTGASYTETQTITLPTTPGQYYFKVITNLGDALAESNYSNDTGTSANANISALYDAQITTVTSNGTDVASGDAGSGYVALGAPVLIQGVATFAGGGIPAAGVGVTVDVIVDGTTRTLQATSASDGTFAVEFQPLSVEAGHYELAADHVSTAALSGSLVPQSAFDIVGLKADYSSVSETLAVNQPATGTLTLSTLGLVNLSNLTFTASSVAPNVQFSPTNTPSAIAAGGHANFNFSVTATDASYTTDNIVLHIHDDQGASLNIPFNLSVLVLTPQLSTSAALDTGLMVPAAGQQVQEQVSFVVTNIGGAVTGDLTVQLPDTSVDGLAPFMSLVTPATITSLAPGESSTVTVQLSADPSLPLNKQYNGTIVIGNSLVDFSESYSLTPTTSTTGAVAVKVGDDYTVRTDANSYLAGAQVQLLDAFDNSQVIATGTTDSTGTATFPTVPAGPYLMVVTAAAHSVYKATINVSAGVTNDETAFCAVNAVSYTWVVTPVTITDTYTIQLTATFDTQVPAPVVTMTTDAIPVITPGGSGQMNVTLSNNGLIAANDVTLDVPTDPEYTFTPLSSDIGSIAAEGTVTVPVMVTRNPGGQQGGGCHLVFSAPYSYVPFNDPTQEVVQNALASVYVPNRVCSSPIPPTTPTPPPGTYGGTGSFGDGGTYDGSTGSGGDGGYSGTGGVGGTGPGVGTPITSDPAVPQVVTAIADAKVTIEIDQQAVLTRTAFGGTLDITNISANPLNDVQFDIQITDAEGNDASGDFSYNSPTLSGFSATGGINPGSAGIARFLFIPTDSAAPTSSQVYNIGGSFSYVDANGDRITVGMSPATITVLPQAHLVLNYFLQRDVYGDNPFTLQVEPSEPFVLGLLVTNEGAGAAQQLTITSSQPTVIDNAKGLLIHFQIIGSQVATQTQSQPSLTVDLGDLPPGASNTAEFDLTSSLQGHFETYSASFTHNGQGGVETSLIDSVTLHELIHAVNVDVAGDPANDAKPDFLSHDSDSGQGATRSYGQAEGPTGSGLVSVTTDLPEELYKSDGTVAAVNDLAADAATVTSTVQSGQSLTYTMSAAEPAGWDYLEIPDPTGLHTGYTLSSVVAPNGRVIEVGNNAWTTDQLFTDGAFIDFKLFHMVDYSATAQNVQYTLVYTTTATPPAIANSQIGDASAQRSSIHSFQVTFNEPVNFNQDSFTLYQQAVSSDGSINLHDPATDVSGGVTATSTDGMTWTFTVKPGGSLDRTSAVAEGQTNAGILGNGIYQLVLHGLAITDAATGSAEFNSGADQIVQFYSAEVNNQNGGMSNYFHSLYGDTNGDGGVDLSDYRVFKTADGASSTDATFNVGLDSNGDGQIDLTDYRAFKAAYGMSFEYSY